MLSNTRKKFSLLILLFILLTGCARMSIPTEVTSPRTLRWPSPPLPPRVEWVREVVTLPRSGVPGIWQRFLTALSGDGEQHLIRSYGVLAEKDKLLIVDSGAARIYLLEGDWVLVTIPSDKERGRLGMPIAAARDNDGNFYFTDASTGMIHRFTSADPALHNFVPRRLGRPTGIAFHPQSRLLYVSDTTAHQVIAFDLGGMEQFRIGSRGEAPGQFNFPTDLCIDRRGQLYVTDALNHRIQIFTPDGQLLGYFGEAGDTSGYLPKPKGVAVDSDGHIYVVDALLDTVQIFDDSGKFLLDFGIHGDRQGEFWMPSGIHIDENDLIYVSDTYNRRIQVFRYLSESGEGQKQ